MWLKLSKVSPVLLSSEDSDFVLITGSKFSPLQVVLRPSELLNALLLEEVFCELEERDFEIKSSKFSLLLSVSVPCDFVRDSIRDVPSLELSAGDAALVFELQLFVLLPSSRFFFFFLSLAGFSADVRASGFLAYVDILARLSCQPFVVS